MKKIALILILIIVSTFAMPIALAVIDIPSITAQAGPAGSGIINGTFLVSNLETYNNARFNVAMVGVRVITTGDAKMISGSDDVDPSGSIIIAKDSGQFYNYDLSVSGIGTIQTQSEVYGRYDENISLGSGSDGSYNYISSPSEIVTVDSALAEFYTSIIPILLSIILFMTMRYRLE